MNIIKWSDGLGPRSRRPFLFLVGGGKIWSFSGETIPGVVAILSSSYVSAGKWSSRTYDLSVAEGVTAIDGRMGFEDGTLLEGLAKFRSPMRTWDDVANFLKVDIPTLREFLSDNFPKTLASLDKVDEALDSIQSPVACLLALSWGRAAKSHNDIVVVVDEKNIEIGRIIPAMGAEGPSWFLTPTAEGNVSLISARISPGHGGGYVSLRIAAPEGCHAERRSQELFHS
jgi:hypothetical protein